MRWKIVFLFGVYLSISACTAKKTREVKALKEHNHAAVADRILVLSIEGMVCEMGCGGSIRKALNKTNSIPSIKFDFEEERAIDTVRIEFNSSIINSDEIIRIIEQVNDGQFKVQLVDEQVMQSQSKKSSRSEDQSTFREEGTIRISEPDFRIPNLIDLLSGLI